jgi:hypothetical protein
MKKRLSLFILIFALTSTYLFSEDYCIGSNTDFGLITEISPMQNKEDGYKVVFIKKGISLTYTVKNGSTLELKDFWFSELITYCYYVEFVKDNAISLKKIEV